MELLHCAGESSLHQGDELGSIPDRRDLAALVAVVIRDGSDGHVCGSSDVFR